MTKNDKIREKKLMSKATAINTAFDENEMNNIHDLLAFEKLANKRFSNTKSKGKGKLLKKKIKK